jgi:hypothetical protein
MNPQPHKNWFLHIVAGIGIITAAIFYLATRRSQATAPTLQTLHRSFDWGQEPPQPTPRPTPLAVHEHGRARAFELSASQRLSRWYSSAVR